MLTLHRRPTHSPLDEQGNSMIEAALVLPVLMLIILGIIQWGFIFAAHVSLRSATTVGARYTTILGGDSPYSPGWDQNAENRVYNVVAGALASMLDPARLANTNATDFIVDARNVNYDPNDPTKTIPVTRVQANYDLRLFFSIVVPNSANGVLRISSTSFMQ